MKKRTIFFASD